jgi:hypothetical protein
MILRQLRSKKQLHVLVLTQRASMMSIWEPQTKQAKTTEMLHEWLPCLLVFQ